MDRRDTYDEQISGIYNLKENYQMDNIGCLQMFC